MFLVAAAQPLTAQKLGLFMKELETKNTLAEASILSHCILPDDLEKIVIKNSTVQISRIANHWVDDCISILKEKDVDNSATDYYLGLARSLIPAIRTLPKPDLIKYVKALGVLKKRYSQGSQIFGN